MAEAWPMARGLALRPISQKTEEKKSDAAVGSAGWS
jgi:hypothetical protein